MKNLSLVLSQIPSQIPSHTTVRHHSKFHKNGLGIIVLVCCASRGPEILVTKIIRLLGITVKTLTIVCCGELY